MINSPQNTTYYNATILVNISSNGASNVWFYNGSANETYTGAGYRTFAEGSTMLVAYANDSFGNINSTSATFTVQLVNNTAPSVVLNAPVSEAIISVNDSLLASVMLNASVFDADGNNLSIWFYGDNALLDTFNATAVGTFAYNWTGLSKGNHSWNVVAFDGYVNGKALPETLASILPLTHHLFLLVRLSSALCSELTKVFLLMWMLIPVRLIRAGTASLQEV